MSRKDIDNKKQEIIGWLEGGMSRAEVCKKLRCKYDTLKARLDKWNVSHLKNQSGKGLSKIGNRVDVKKYLKKNGPSITSDKLKKRLIRDGYKKNVCEICGINKWRQQKIPLELDHINGDRFDNRIGNLRILCPNCHSIQPTNSGKNVGSYK